MIHIQRSSDGTLVRGSLLCVLSIIIATELKYRSAPHASMLLLTEPWSLIPLLCPLQGIN